MTDSTAPAAKPAAKKSKDVVDEVLAAPTRSPEEIQTDIDAAQQRLADQVDVLSERLAPQALAEEALGGVKKVFVEADGSPRTRPIAIAAGTVAGLLLLRKIFHR